MGLKSSSNDSLENADHDLGDQSEASARPATQTKVKETPRLMVPQSDVKADKKFQNIEKKQNPFFNFDMSNSLQ